MKIQRITLAVAMLSNKGLSVLDPSIKHQLRHLPGDFTDLDTWNPTEADIIGEGGGHAVMQHRRSAKALFLSAPGLRIEPQDPDADPASIIEEELAEWDPYAELEPLDPELQDIFGGHPGGVQDDRPENHTGLNPKTTVIDRLAFYLPFHYFRDWWGIYIFPEGILRIRQELQPFFCTHGIGPREQMRLAKQLLYHHEYYHHAVESFGTRLEAVVNKPCYLSGFSPRYRQTVHSPQCLEETCANSYAREKLLKNHKALGVARGDLAVAINEWFSGQPYGYREAKDTTGSWTRKLRPLLFEDYVQSTPGLGSALSSDKLKLGRRPDYLCFALSPSYTPSELDSFCSECKDYIRTDDGDEARRHAGHVPK